MELTAEVNYFIYEAMNIAWIIQVYALYIYPI